MVLGLRVECLYSEDVGAVEVEADLEVFVLTFEAAW